MSYDAIQEKGAAQLLSRVLSCVNAVYDYMTGSAITIWANVITILFCLLFIGHSNPLTAALLLTLLPINYFGYKMLNKELAKRSVALSKTSGESWQILLSRCQQVDYLKQCPDYQNVLSELDAPLEKNYRAMRDINVYAQMSSQLIESVNEIIKTLAMLLVAYGILSSGDGLGEMILFSILLPIYVSRVSAITNSNLQKKQYEANLALIREMEEEKETNGTEELSEIREIRFDCDSITVGKSTIKAPAAGNGVVDPRGSRQAKINGPFRASFQKGDVVWVKGPSGCGKSSLMKLLPKFRTQTGVRLNGKEISCYDSRQLRARINYLSQNVPIIQDTLKNNLFFNLPYDEKRAQSFPEESLLSTILKNHSLDDRITENGSNLSGGEKQKIALSRVIDSHPDVWILDEITSNIDRDSALEILERIMRKKEESIIFIISHDDLPEGFVNRVWDVEG